MDNLKRELDVLFGANDRSVVELHHEGSQRVLTQHVAPGDEVCDFCGSRAGLQTRFDCADFQMLCKREDGSTTLHRYNGAWMACPFCAGFVAANAREALAQRALRALQATHGVPDAAINDIRALHAKFWEHRK